MRTRNTPGTSCRTIMLPRPTMITSPRSASFVIAWRTTSW